MGGSILETLLLLEVVVLYSLRAARRADRRGGAGVAARLGERLGDLGDAGP